jgi:hypothetical protein
MVVAAVDERHLHGCVLQSLGYAEPAETASNDYDSMPIRHISIPGLITRCTDSTYSTSLDSVRMRARG